MMFARGSKIASSLVSRTPTTSRLRSLSTVEKTKENTLYQYAICPFCNIVKATLDYSQTPYNAIEVNPLNKKELKWSEEYKKVPIASLEGDVIYGSAEIVEGLLTKHNDKELWPPSKQTEKWTKYAMDDLAPLLYPNLCNTLPNSYNAFGYVHGVDTFSTAEKYSIQYIGSLAMYFAASKIKKKRGIDDVEEALRGALVELEEHLKRGSPFLNSASKTEPDLGDLFVFGVLRGLEGLPVHDKVMVEFDSISNWYQSMDSIVKEQKMGTA
ncbi:unnamed protein product [Cylindrotheca closterium]|uniref:GST N-terminal domain-containing protein n=1 Tax=Cylindrotheca closterium TaxID=2856 RepID=A0AAD2FLI7_9STRA|nr:unnamed protein product [Cylindrotheca closterium]